MMKPHDEPDGDEGPVDPGGLERDTLDDTFLHALTAARAGDPEALGRTVEPFRPFLLLLAERELSADLKVKEGASDLVQDTLLEAQRDIGRFQGHSPQDLRAWLRQMLLHRVYRTSRRYRKTAKRRMGRELHQDATRPGQGLADAIASDSTSPSGRAIRGEEEALVLAALARLPKPARQAILWRHRDECSFEEIGRRLDMSDTGARKLWLRAVERLRRELNVSPDPDDGPT